MILVPGISCTSQISCHFYKNSGRDWRRLGLWFIPVGPIPAIWPIHSMLMGQFDLWLNGAFGKPGGERRARYLGIHLILYSNSTQYFFVLGLVGVLYSAVKRDYFILLGTIPFVVL